MAENSTENIQKKNRPVFKMYFDETFNFDTSLTYPWYP